MLIVPLKGSIRITTGMVLRAMYPKVPMWQKALIRLYLLCERIQGVKLW